MARTALGELEHLVLVAILRLGQQAYGAAIIAEIEQQTKRDVSHAAAYIALQRLQQKGLVSARTMTGTSERGGRPKAVFTMTPLGRERLRESATALFTMWRGFDPAMRGKGRS